MKKCELRCLINYKGLKSCFIDNSDKDLFNKCQVSFTLRMSILK